MKLQGPLYNILVPRETNLDTTFSKYSYLMYPYVRERKMLDDSSYRNMFYSLSSVNVSLHHLAILFMSCHTLWELLWNISVMRRVGERSGFLLTYLLSKSSLVFTGHDSVHSKRNLKTGGNTVCAVTISPCRLFRQCDWSGFSQQRIIAEKAVLILLCSLL